MPSIRLPAKLHGHCTSILLTRMCLSIKKSTRNSGTIVNYGATRNSVLVPPGHMGAITRHLASRAPSAVKKKRADGRLQYM